MFVIENSGTYTWPIKVKTPVDGGKFKEESFTAVFKRKSYEEILVFKNDIAESQLDDAEIAKRVMVGWHEVLDANKNEIPFNEENLKSLLNIPGAPGSIVVAFMESIMGIKRKN